VNTWKVICATLVIFITGVVTGGLLVSYADRASQRKRPFRPHEVARPLANNSNPTPATNPRDPARPLNQLPNRFPRGISLEFLQRLSAEVQLTSGQRERLEQIIAEGQLRNKEIWERITPELRREMTETQRRIRDILTPEQLVRFEELMKQSRSTGRRSNEEPLPPGNRPRDQRRPLPPREAPDASPPAPQSNP
jgi:hypothetical protein